MIKRFWEIFKKRPYLIGGAILAGALLLWLLWPDGEEIEEDKGPIYPGLDPNLLAAQTALAAKTIETSGMTAVAQISAQSRLDELNAQIQLGTSALEAQTTQLHETALANIAIADIQKSIAQSSFERDIELGEQELAAATLVSHDTLTFGMEQLRQQGIQDFLAALTSSFVATSQAPWQAWGAYATIPSELPKGKGKGKIKFRDPPPQPKTSIDGATYTTLFNNIIRYAQGYQPYESIPGAPQYVVPPEIQQLLQPGQPYWRQRSIKAVKEGWGQWISLPQGEVQTPAV